MSANAVARHEERAGLLLAIGSYITFILNGSFIRTEAMVFVAAALGMGSLIAILPHWREFPIYLKHMLILLFVSIFLVAYKVLYFPVAFAFLATIPSTIAIAIYIYKYPRLFQVRPILYLMLFLFYAALLLGISPDSVFAGSRNQISVVLISFAALSLALEQRKSDVAIALVVFATCVLAVGSSGVLASAILVGATVFKQNRTWYSKLLTLVAVVLVVVAFQIYVEYYAPHDFTRKFSFDRLTGSDVRFQIISDYLKRYTDGAYLFLGAPDQYTFYVWSSISGGGRWAYVSTLHNSYLSVHAKVGMLAFVVYFILVRVGFALRVDLYILMLYLAILVRAFGDSVFVLDGHYNFSLYYFFVLASLASRRHIAANQVGRKWAQWRADFGSQVPGLAARIASRDADGVRS